MKKRLLSLTLALALIITALTACSPPVAETDTPTDTSKEEDTKDNDVTVEYDPFGKYDDTVKMLIGRDTVAQTNLPDGHTMEDNNYIKALKDWLNIEVEYDWLADSSNIETYNQRVNMAIVTNDIPDVMLVYDLNQLNELIEGDMVEDLTYAFNNFKSPLLQDYYESYGYGDGNVDIAGATSDGKLFAIPNLNIGYQHGLLWIREDWMDELGASAPTTLDEVLDLARMFIEEDPGGNGPGNTIGFTANNKVAGIYNGIHQLDPIFAAYDSFPRSWVKDDATGEYVYGTITSETREALVKVAEMYEDGLIDRQFAVRSQSDINELTAAGRAGMTFGPWWIPFWPLGDTVNNNPEARWIAVKAPLNDDGIFHVPMQDRHTAWFVVRKGYEHPEALIKGLNLMYESMRMLDDDLAELYPPDTAVDWGVWPFSIQLDYNDAVPRGNETIRQGVADGSSDHPSHGTTVENVIKYMDEGELVHWAGYAAWYNAAGLTDTANTVFADFAFPGVTDTMATRWANLERLEDETLLSIIMGEASIDSFDDFVEEWKRLGGEDITTEVNELFDD